MISAIEKRISYLSQWQFGPQDPRIPSNASRPGGQLSFHNEALILEAKIRAAENLQRDRELSEKERHAYWSDQQHLAQKLEHTVIYVASVSHEPVEQLSEVFAIVKGTGQVVRKIGKDFHYVEINTGDEEKPVYVSDKAILPKSQITLLVSALELGIVR